MPVWTRSSKYVKDYTDAASSIDTATSSKSQTKSISSSSTLQTKGFSSSSTSQTKDSNPTATLQKKHIVSTTPSYLFHSTKTTAATSEPICAPLCPSKINAPSPSSPLNITISSGSRSVSPKLALLSSLTISSHSPTNNNPQYQQIFSTKLTGAIVTSHRLDARSPSCSGLSTISSSSTPRKRSCSTISTYSSTISPILDTSSDLTATPINHNMYETFDKGSSSPTSFVLPTDSLPSSPEAFILQLSPRASFLPSSSTNYSPTTHDQTLPRQLNDSSDHNLNITGHDAGLEDISDMSDSQYEAYLHGEIKFGESTKSKPVLFMKKYTYLHMSTAPTLGTSGYRCARKDLNCPATIHIHTASNQFHRWNGKKHTHIPDSTEQRRREIISIIKKRVVNEHRPVCSIVEEEYAKAKLTTEEKLLFKTPKSLESGLLKARRKMYPPLPTDQNFTIPDTLSRTIDSSPFLLSDQRDDQFGGRLLIFSSQTQMDTLLSSDILMADGTFRSCPRFFEQIYVIMAVKNRETYPVLFALTSNRKEETYTAILNTIQEEAGRRGVSFAPHTFISDFERPWINAVRKTLLTTSVSGCWFHFVQSIYRWIQTNGLLKIYEEHEDKRQILRAYMALSLLPRDRVMEGHSIVKKCAKKYRDLLQFAAYFEREWIKTFNPDLWCVGSSNFRTNNSTESNNHRINSRIIQRHPNIWRFLTHLRNEEAVINQKIFKANLALTTPARYQSTCKKRAAKKTMQIIHLHDLLQQQSRTLEDVIKSLSFLIGDRIVGKGKMKK